MRQGVKSVMAGAATLATSAYADRSMKIEQLEPGVFHVPLQRYYAQGDEIVEHPNLQSEHPRVGNWSDAEYWNHIVKEPITSSNLGNYMYTMECKLGDTTINEDPSLCVVDSTTSISSIFGEKSKNNGLCFRPRIIEDSSTYVSPADVTAEDFESLGVMLNGVYSEDTWCLGDDDPHTYVCMENQPFMLVNSETDPDTSQWDLPFYYFGRYLGKNVHAILGLGNGDPANDPNIAMNFINRAYEEGLLKNNTYSFQGLNGDQKYASMTIGGYSDRLFSSDIEWYDLNPTTADGSYVNETPVSNWRLTFSNFTIDTYNLMNAPSSDPQVYESSPLKDDPTTEFKVYGHFNTGYPFIGVDENVAPLVLEDLQHFRPDVSCELHKTYNPMKVCYWKDTCDDNLFGTANMTFAFGTDAQFNLPMKEMLVNYTVNGDSYCGFAFQQVDMPFDLTKERHFYFGDVFFMNFAGVFDFTSGKIGMALSSYSPTGVTFDCAGGCAEPDPTPDPGPEPGPSPEPPTPGPEPTPEPSDPTNDDDDSHLIWLWLVIALLLIILVVGGIAFYYRKKSQRAAEMNAILYGAGVSAHDGDMIEKDLTGKGKNRTTQFSDHEEIMRETMVEEETPDKDFYGDPTPNGYEAPLAQDDEI